MRFDGIFKGHCYLFSEFRERLRLKISRGCVECATLVLKLSNLAHFAKTLITYNTFQLAFSIQLSKIKKKRYALDN